MGLCKKHFAACGGERLFGCRHLFHDFALQNHEKYVGFKLKFGAKRRKILFTQSQYFFEGHVILTISRSEIVKMTCPSKHNSALRAEKTF